MPEEKPAEEKPADEKPSADAANDLDSLLSDDKPAATPAAPEAPSEPAAEEPPAEDLGPRDAPSLSLADLSAALQSAAQATAKMNAAQAANNEAEIKRARKDFYLSLYGLGYALALVHDDAAAQQVGALRKSIEQMTLAMAADPKRLDALRGNAARWMAFSKRTTEGIVLAGTVADVEHVGKLYYVKLELGPSSETTIVCSHDPKLAPHGEAIALGTIVEHPEQQLAGYEGLDTPVVWSGLTLELPGGGK